MQSDKFFTAPITTNTWRRVVLIILLGISLTFNYMIYRDNQFLTLRHDVMEAGFIDDYLGYDYCGQFGEINEHD